MIFSNKSYLITIEIEEDSWRQYKKGQILKFAIFAKTRKSREIILDNNYRGSEMPDYKIIEIEELGDMFLFPNYVQQGIIKP